VAKHRNVSQSDFSIFIYPLTELYLHGEFLNGKPAGGRISQLQIFSSLALGILFIACINFINLSTARSQKRAKEIGIKKTLGASQTDLKVQFLSEFLILTVISVFFGLLIVELSLPWFNAMLDTRLTIDYLDFSNWIFFIALIAVTTLLAGGYPAFVLASMDAIKSLKGRAPAGSIFALSIRKSLVVVQFGFSLIVIVATIIIYQQLSFLKNKPLGYNASYLVQMPHEGNLYFKFDLLKDRLLTSGAIESICQSSGSIALANNKTVKPEWDGMTEIDKTVLFDQIYTTYDLVKTTGITLISGNDFSKARLSDKNGLLLNEAAVKTMNLLNPIGKRIRLNGELRQVIGVFKDIVWGDPALHSKPMVVAFNEENSDFITMRLNAKNLQANIAKIASITKNINPDFPVDLTFVDKLVEGKYRDEQRMASISNLFGGFSIFLSCLGLFALSAFSAELRTKEIGIRKVLGASLVNMVALLSIEFLQTVLLAIVIAVLPAYLIMSRWLDNFDYHISIQPAIFIFSGIGVLVVSFLTVAWHSFNAANKNPVETLKYE
jgi:putative ABC transport system permease protein